LPCRALLAPPFASYTPAEVSMLVFCLNASLLVFTITRQHTSLSSSPGLAPGSFGALRASASAQPQRPAWATAPRMQTAVLRSLPGTVAAWTNAWPDACESGCWCAGQPRGHDACSSSSAEPRTQSVRRTQTHHRQVETNDTQHTLFFSCCLSLSISFGRLSSFCKHGHTSM
jgi:hypothetical protein